MTGRQLRWLLLATASALVTFVLVRRRQQLADALPQPLLQRAERFEIPWRTLERAGTLGNSERDGSQVAEEEVEVVENEPDADSLRRKVSTGSRISFRGKRYGPLPESLVGHYVDVETRGDQLFVLHEGNPIANYTLQS